MPHAVSLRCWIIPLLFWIPFAQCIDHPAERGHSANLRNGHRIASNLADSGAMQKGPNDDEDITHSPPSDLIYVKNFNVYMHSKEDHKEIQLTKDGTKKTPYLEDQVWPSKDKKFAVVHHLTTPGTNRTITLVESSPPEQVQPKLHEIEYPKPGDDLPLQRVALFDLIKQKQIPVQNDLFPNPFGLFSADWSHNDQKYRFGYNERGHKLFSLLEIDRTSGKVEALITETAEEFIDWTNKVHWDFFNTTSEIWWMSERDDWNHIYLYDADDPDKKPRQVTKGQWNVYEVVRVDEKKRQMWFKGFGMVEGQDPYYMHLARINLDGTGMEILTKEANGYHRFVWKDDEGTFEDRWSRVDQLEQGVLRHLNNGSVIRKLQNSEVFGRLMDNVTFPEMFNATGRDGNTMIYGIIIQPRNFDENKQYPILEYVYAGPQDFYVPKGLTEYEQEDLSWFQKQADDLNVVLVTADGMGTNWRGRKFHEVCYKNLKDAGFEDRIAWIKATAKTRPWMNVEKIAIYGTSAGGQNALGAMLWHNDFYQAAVADAGCHDNRVDKMWWNEQWMGYPVDNSYAGSSNVVHAGRLEGKLLLLVGELDTNVDPSSTLQVVNALNNAGKDYQLLVVPGQGHGTFRPRWTDAPNVQSLVNGFWHKWLMDD